MATVPETRTTRGFKAPCPNCGREEVSLTLANVEKLHCELCEAEFTLHSIRALVESWTAVLEWIDAAPNYPE